MRRATWGGSAGVALLALTACGDADGGSTGHGASSTGGVAPPVCADGFAPAADGGGCLEIAAEGDCPAGSRAAIGETGCAPVGWTSCPAGMDPDPSGWGCAPLLPPLHCTGATMERVGNAQCVPVGDCDAPFPPANADVFVDAAFGPEELDGSHFATIGDALAAAPDGATIAIESGTYTEALEIEQSVSLVGRCAGSVTIASPGGIVAGITSWADDVRIRGLTITGHGGGGVLVHGESNRVEQCILGDNDGFGAAAFGGEVTVAETKVANTGLLEGYGLGVFALEGGAVQVLDSSIARSSQLGIGVAKGSSAEIMRSVLRDTITTASGAARGIQADTSSSLHVEDSALLDNAGTSIAVGDAGSTAIVRRSVLRGGANAGLLVRNGATIEIDECLVGNFDDWGMYAAEGSVASVHASVFLGGNGDVPNTTGGILLDSGAIATVDDVAVVGNKGAGMQVQDPPSHATLQRSLIAGTRSTPKETDGFGLGVGFGSALVADDVTLDDNQSAAFIVFGSGPLGEASTATVTRLLVRDTVASNDGRFGRGVDVSDGASLSMSHSALVRSSEIALSVAFGASADIADSSVHATASSPDGAADGAMVIDATLELSRSTVLGNARIALAFSGANGAVDGCQVVANGVGIHVQDGSQLQDADTVTEPPAALQVLVTPTTQFIGNLTRVGSGQIPIPSPLGAFAP